MTGNPPRALQSACFVGNHVPRKCGIATFTSDLAEAVRKQGMPSTVVALNDPGSTYEYPADVVYQIPEKRVSSYRAAADYLNLQECSVVCLQHEYGIFGGPAGSHVLQLLSNLRMPLVTTLHTLLEEPSKEQFEVLEQITQLSQRVIVMTEKARSILLKQTKVDPGRVDLILHGTPDVVYKDPNTLKQQIDAEGRDVLLTFGLLSPDKGIEYVIQGLPTLVEQNPNLLYIVLGATHPHVRAQTGDAYRKELYKQVEKLGLQNNVRFEDRFVSLDELVMYLQSADIYVTPYLKPQQVTSGTLAYAYSCGKPIVSTPYWHAEELLSDNRGVLVPFRDSEALSQSIGLLLADDQLRTEMATNAYRNGRAMAWPNVGREYIKCFETAIQDSKSHLQKIYQVGQPAFIGLEPRIDLRHLQTMTDDTGIIQHALGPMPNRNEGYCVDDNARALLTCARLSKLGLSNLVERLSTVYLSFTHHSWNPESNRFRNFMAFDRTWLEEAGSEDSHGRAVWGLGEWVASSLPVEMRRVAHLVMQDAISSIPSFTSPRAWAYALIGICQDTSPFTGECFARDVTSELAHRLKDLYRTNYHANWPWFESYLTYDNARLSQAMILAGRTLENQELIQIGLESLDWVCRQQVGVNGEFFPVGSDEVWHRNRAKAPFDHQPLEAWAVVDASVEAAGVSDSPVWAERAKWAVDWFYGRNHLRQPVVDIRTGGCRDGIQPDRMNENQGAESTIASIAATAKWLEFVQSENWKIVGYGNK